MSRSSAESWEPLVGILYSIVDDLATRVGVQMSFTIGGGTMLMLRYRHRRSRDLDVFLTDAQLLSFLTPRLNDFTAKLTAEYVESGSALKLVLGAQEIDFIAAAPVTSAPSRPQPLLDRVVEIEEPREIIAKKLLYRGRSLAARDVFDVVAVAEIDPSQLEGFGNLLGRRVLRDLAARIPELELFYEREAATRIDALENGKPFVAGGMTPFKGLVRSWHEETGEPVPAALTSDGR